jgi:G:T-mismatch repair DNA endonuclease (very short patch repair protein)
MQYTLDGNTILTAVVCALWAVAFAACGIWVTRVRSDSKEDREAIGQLQKDLATFREFVARECASRNEVKDEREETRVLFQRIDARIDEIKSYLIKAPKS